ncbi:MAG: hypothetical protein QF599_00375 [Planctomycetota bacterium]|jgi:hypothetical protein|nr:hypothetical protein [Planctomycetota bacterium]
MNNEIDQVQKNLWDAVCLLEKHLEEKSLDKDNSTVYRNIIEAWVALHDYMKSSEKIYGNEEKTNE